MAVYKIFPDKDTFIFTELATANAGYDEMIEIGAYPIQEIGQTSRVLIHWKDTEVTNVISTKIGSYPFTASIHLDIASAYEIPASHSVECFPVAQYWDGGIGKYGDDLYTGSEDTSGGSWKYTKAGKKVAWYEQGSFPNNVTGSYTSAFVGGGSWYTGSSGLNLMSTQSFDTNDDLDIRMDVTNGVHLHYSGTLENYGFLLKFEDGIEFNTTSSIRAKYFSANTNTIYPPTLTFTWDDQSYVTGSLNVLSDPTAYVKITNNGGEYPDVGKQRFRLLARPKYPSRTFTTGSIFRTNYALNSGSVYALRDEFTEDLVIPFNSAYSKISCDSSGPYFDIFMNGLQPERYYRILVRSEIDGTLCTFDDANVFKIVRNG
jgi:hypothetical protein